MSAKKRPYNGNARFIELGSLGQPFRTLINVDHLTNLRYEQKIELQEVPVPGGAPAKDAVYDKDTGEMLAPPQAAETQKIPMLMGFNIVLVFGAETQAIFFNDEAQSVTVYNTVLDMISGTGAPIARMPKLTPQPPEEVPSGLVGADGAPLGAVNDDDVPAPGEVPDLTDEELDQLANPEIDVDAIADAVDKGVDDDRPN